MRLWCGLASLSGCIQVASLLLLNGCAERADRDEGIYAHPGFENKLTSQYEGELNLSAESVSLTMCSELSTRQIAGPLRKEIARRYAAVHTTPSAPVMAWLEGYFVKVPKADSALFVTNVLHMDATKRCPPLPSAELAGHYKTAAIIYTSVIGPQDPLEEDGTWGVRDGEVSIQWSRRGNVMTFQEVDGKLVATMQRTDGGEFVLERTGEPDPSGGTLGEVKRILIQIAREQMLPVEPSGITAHSRLHELFGADSTITRTALRDRFQREYQIPEAERARVWERTATVADLADLARRQKKKLKN